MVSITKIKKSTGKAKCGYCRKKIGKEYLKQIEMIRRNSYNSFVTFNFHLGCFFELKYMDFLCCIKCEKLFDFDNPNLKFVKKLGFICKDCWGECWLNE